MSFLGEIKRRKVFQVAAVYLVVAWLIMQVVDVVSDPLLLPEWFSRVVIVLLIIGFPLALVLSWAFDLTPEGVVKDQGASKNSGRQIEYALLALIVVAVGWLFYRTELSPSSQVDTFAVQEEQREKLPNSVAVLPFANFSPDPDNAYFALGIHDTILNELVNIAELNVIARTSVLRYADGETSIAQIAEELNVETVMEGTVQYADGQVRITAQLIDPETGAHIWSGNYDRPFSDIFMIQSEIAGRISAALRSELLPEERQRIEERWTDSPEAYALYLQAVANYENHEFWQQSLNQAIEIDSDFALAYEEIAENYALAYRGSVEGWEIIVEENSAKALALDPTLTRAEMAQAMALEASWQWTAAEAAFDRAFRANPNDPNVLLFYGRFKRVIGDYPGSIEMLRRAIELDPVGEGHIQLGITYKFARMHAEAASALNDAILLDPTARNLRIHIADAEVGRGNAAEALVHLQLAENLNIGIPYRFAQTMVTYSRLDRPEDVARVFGELEREAEVSTVGDATWAMAYLALGEYEDSLRYLEDAVGNKTALDSQPLIALKANPWGLDVLEEPRFLELLEQIAGD